MREDKVFKNLELLRLQLDEDKRGVLDFFQNNEGPNSVAVVILNYNGLHHLQKHLSSVIRHTTAKIIVADNGSTDESVVWLKENHPDIELIVLPTNYGFAEGYNQAIRKVHATYVVLLNSDVEVTRQWLEPMISTLKSNKQIGAIQPKVKSFENKSNFEYAGACGGLMDTLGYPFCQGRILSEVEQDFGQYDKAREVFWATGAAMSIRRKVFMDFGGFDGSFFAHMEEIDLCWRMKQAGYQIWTQPDSVIYHQGGGTLSYTSPRKTYLNFRNGMSLLIKNEKGLKLLWLFPVRLALDLLAGLRFIIVAEWKNAWAVVKAMLYTFRHFFSTWKKRKHILALTQKLSIGEDNTNSGRYQGSIVWEFFLLGKKKYHDLRKVPSSKQIS
ncbi:MAG: glycosyltransferase family 2 protein [Saprospiraceae bacterium]|nr:glycosyltransferase family 2 protein [Saprospiraceae bacterium]